MLLLSQLKNRIKVVLPLLSDSLADDNVLLNKKILVVVTRVIVNWNSRKGENRDFSSFLLFSFVYLELICYCEFRVGENQNIFCVETYFFYNKPLHSRIFL